MNTYFWLCIMIYSGICKYRILLLNEFLPKYIVLLHYVDLAECG
jgi:hypothetical protein